MESQNLNQLLDDKLCLMCYDDVTSETFVNENPKVIDCIFRILDTKVFVPGLTCDFETFDRFCGRAVWEGLYQPLKKSLRLPHKNDNAPHYTAILFG